MMRKISVAPDGSFVMQTENGERAVDLLVRGDGVVCAEFARAPITITVNEHPQSNLSQVAQQQRIAGQ